MTSGSSNTNPQEVQTREVQTREVQTREVVLVPGLLTPGFLMAGLARRLRANGFTAKTFSYPALSAPAAEHAVALQQFIEAETSGHVHLVGHSFGGIVILHRFEHLQTQRSSANLSNFARSSSSPASIATASVATASIDTGRVLLLASPVRGSDVARHLVARPRSGRLWRKFLSHTLVRGLLGGVPEVSVPTSVGVIAGTRNRGGLSWLLKLQHPVPEASGSVSAGAAVSDGLVSIAETRLQRSVVSLQMPVSHAGFLWSRPAAEQTAHFLQHGHFLDP